jgi:hypothetical protein
MHAQLIGPERFIAERVMAEDLPALRRQHRIRRGIRRLIAGAISLACSDTGITASTSRDEKRCPGQQAAEGNPASLISQPARTLGNSVPDKRQSTSPYKGIRTFHFPSPE